jgi:hypothetical protein
MPKSALIALALLVCGCVIAALAGPALSLRLRTEALHQALGPEGTTATAVAVTSDWSAYTTTQPGLPMSDDTIATGTDVIGAGLAGTPLPLAAGAWGSLTTGLYGFGHVGGLMARLEIAARDPLASYLRVTTGTLSAASVPAKMLGVALTQQTGHRHARLRTDETAPYVDRVHLPVIRADPDPVRRGKRGRAAAHRGRGAQAARGTGQG